MGFTRSHYFQYYMKTKNSIVCDRCGAVSNQKTRHQAFIVDKYQSVRSLEHRNILKDFCPSCFATYEVLGKIKDGSIQF